MDGFQSPGALGILYAEDFGLEAEMPVTPPPPRQPETPPLTQADIDVACQHAVLAAELTWNQSLETRRTIALETLVAGLGEARQAAERQAEAVAEGVAQAALGMVTALLPDLSKAFGDNEVRALLARVLPVLARNNQVVVRVHAGLLATIRTDLEALEHGTADRVELRPANLPVGDARLSWEAGSMSRDGAAIRRAIEDGLTELGLSGSAVTARETRSVAHVQ